MNIDPRIDAYIEKAQPFARPIPACRSSKNSPIKVPGNDWAFV